MNSKLVALALVGSITLGGVVILSEEYKTSGATGDTTVAELCSGLDLSATSSPGVAVLCEALHNVSLSDPIECNDAGTTFTMVEVLSADDPEAAYTGVMDRCNPGLDMEGRRMVLDYGWCSSSLSFILTRANDSAEWCTQNNHCDSYIGCGSKLSGCCIEHDKCLQSEDTGSCKGNNINGGCCDKRLSSCAWGSISSCCRWTWRGPRCDGTCLFYSTLTWASMANTPNTHVKPNGARC